MEVVGRFIEVEKPVRVVRRVEVPVSPTGRDWPEVLERLVKQIDTGRLYDRDLPAAARVLTDVLGALQRREAGRRRFR